MYWYREPVGTALITAGREKSVTSVNYSKGSHNDKPDNHGYQNATADPWEQSRSGNQSNDDTLSSSQAVKGNAEQARQTIANEILEAAKAVCGELIADTERTLEKARFLEGEADRKHCRRSAIMGHF
jgi:hypothetical protein